MESTSAILIREAAQEDMQAVLALIQELAVYENAADEVSNTTANLIEDGFGPDKVFDCFVAVHQNEIIGFALYYTSYSTWKGRCLYLEDFLVTENWRRKGIGKMLFDRVFEVAKARKVKRFEWQVLDWNEPAINFYKKYSAQLDESWINAKIML